MKADALVAWEEMHDRVLVDIEMENDEYNKGILKLNKTHCESSIARNASNFLNFHYRCHRGTRRGMPVQPTAPSRRVTPNGSRQKIDNASKTKGLPTRSITTKRNHNAGECFANNQPFAKKAGRVMVSNTKYPGQSQRGSDDNSQATSSRANVTAENVGITFVDNAPTLTLEERKRVPKKIELTVINNAPTITLKKRKR